ncbi:hypothetical protein BDV28DRAFT_147505 [Aspergillus coremiiformis]|uniref:Heterokaryon incompatibility domain-containing protein n=1 Tax=Aspergillus coremiiformis TaxID=138285 RepID=A0A5N6ZAX5_9EURO|nr:hypothetical protein BDV28DRAFT_147505 [Aspergillus coremiiformis]
MEERIVEQGLLGVFVERYLQEQGQGGRYSRGLNNWLKLQTIVFSNPPDPRKPAFVNALSASQALSGTLLSEWWFANAQARQFSESARDLIKNASLRETQSTVAPDPELIQPREEDGDKYIYHEELFLLWQVEFLSHDGTVGETYITTLQRHRQDAALVASCQRTAWHAFGSLGGTNPPLTESTSSDTVAPTTFEEKVLSLSDCRAFAQNIANQNTKKDLPYYLWDVKNGWTVKTEDLVQRVDYVVISHTWGRWRKKQEPAVRVAGVPWDIPQNSRFEVEKLPEIVRNMDITAPYIWTDLLCIPQDRSKPQQERVYNSEIDRQALIFGSAKAGAIWLNDVESWEGMIVTVSWLCLKYLIASRPNVDDNLRGLLHSATESANAPTGLFGPYEWAGANSYMGAPSGWFSSLWTLQEACLRPQMGFLNREGKGLFAGKSRDSLMTLDGLLALAHWVGLNLVKINAELLPPYSEIPQGPLEVFKLSDEFQLSSLLNIDPLKLLGMTNLRYCSHSRARAIMSAIGATGWWSEHLQKYGRPPPETDLVLGRFPRAFVNEIRKQLGAAFFGSVSLSLDFTDILVSGDTDSRFGHRVIGSMLPFSSSANRPKGSHVWSHEFRDHPSVNTWRICTDGCVEMREIGLVAAADTGDFTGFSKACTLPARIMAPGSDGRMKPEDVDLQEWVETFQPIWPDMNVYAVCLCYGGPSGRDWGVILQQVPYREQYRLDPLTGDVKLLVKIGAYILTGAQQHKEPDTQKVDWLIL